VIDLDDLERLHREGLRYPEGVEYDVARTEAFDALPELLRLARRARQLEEEQRVAKDAHFARMDSEEARTGGRCLEEVLESERALRAALAEGEKP